MNPIENAFEAVLWDFDGVVIDSEPLHAEAWREALAPLGVHIVAEEFLRRFVGVEDHDVIRTLAAEQIPPRSFDELWVAFDDKQERFLAKVMARPHVPEATGAALRDLRSAGYRIGLVTSSSSAEVSPVLERNGILDAFDVKIFAESVTRKKPDPEPYRTAMEKLGIQRALVLEDSDAGAQSATAAGCEVLRIHDVEQAASLLRERLGWTEPIG